MHRLGGEPHELGVARRLLVAEASHHLRVGRIEAAAASGHSASAKEQANEEPDVHLKRAILLKLSFTEVGRGQVVSVIDFIATIRVRIPLKSIIFL